MSKLRTSILIVCEGESTEPSYFSNLRDLVFNKLRKINKINDYSIEIKPTPPQDKENNIFELREGAKRRTTKSDIVLKDEEIVIEEEYKAQPICYVRKAQILGCENYIYNDVWAVFDKDEHPKHEEAFSLAEQLINDRKVNIAFTSIAFEYWILLHFEMNLTPFKKSMCRITNDLSKRIYLFCGSNNHDLDCKGEKCVCGKLVSNKYLSYDGKHKEFGFKNFHSKVNTAIKNAIDLRKSYTENNSPIYSLNPYTNIDRLVFKLLQLPINYHWFDLNEIQTKGYLQFNLSIIEKSLQINYENISDRTQILLSGTFKLLDIEGNSIYESPRKIISKLNVIESLIVPLSLNSIYISFELEENSRYISELI